MLVITLAAQEQVSRRAFTRYFPGVFASLIGVLFGFLFSSVWDVWKNYQSRHAELTRAVRSIDHEISTNLELISRDLLMINKDDSAID